MNGDGYATGTALFALHETRRLSAEAPAYKRGVEFLLRTQEDDGSWLVPTRAIPLNGYLESGSPHEISISSSRSPAHAGRRWLSPSQRE